MNLFFQPFFCFRSNFRAITRLETLATQATTRDMCRPVFQILTLFQTKKCNFSHPFSDLASKPLKSTPVFRHIHIWLITLLDVTCCVRLDTLLHVVGSFCANFENALEKKIELAT